MRHDNFQFRRFVRSRFLGALLEHELAERGKRRLERHRIESKLDPTKTLASFDFAEVPMLSKAHVMALASGDAWPENGVTILIFGPPGITRLAPTPRVIPIRSSHTTSWFRV